MKEEEKRDKRECNITVIYVTFTVTIKQRLVFISAHWNKQKERKEKKKMKKGKKENKNIMFLWFKPRGYSIIGQFIVPKPTTISKRFCKNFERVWKGPRV